MRKTSTVLFLWVVWVGTIFFIGGPAIRAIMTLTVRLFNAVSG